MICDKRTENHNFTITTNTSQRVEFFHSLIFSDCTNLIDSSRFSQKEIAVMESKKAEAMKEYMKANKESSIYEHRLTTLSEMIPLELERKIHLEDLLEREKRDIETLQKTKDNMLEGKLIVLLYHR